jgi:DNA-binding transcriptional LysR family regulator
LEARTRICAGDLQGEPFITLSRTEGVQEDVERVFRREKIEIRGQRVPNVNSCCALVENGVGVTLVEQGAATLFAARPIILKRFSPAIPVTFYAYWLDKTQPRLGRHAFINLLKTEARKMECALDNRLGPVE